MQMQAVQGSVRNVHSGKSTGPRYTPQLSSPHVGFAIPIMVKSPEAFPGWQHSLQRSHYRTCL